MGDEAVQFVEGAGSGATSMGSPAAGAFTSTSTLFRRMDAHLARQDAELRIITEALREQHVLMQQTAQTRADTSRFLVEAPAEHKAARAGITRLLIQTAERLERQG